MSTNTIKLDALPAAGICVNVNAVVELSPLNSSICGDACADTIDVVERPRKTTKILEPLLGADAKVIFGEPEDKEILNE